MSSVHDEIREFFQKYMVGSLSKRQKTRLNLT